VVEAAHVFGRFFTGQVTAAGKVPPAKVLVAGAGVAGLAAIGAAGSMGAIVYATDPRPEVADQVKSLGGEYLPVAAADPSEAAVSATGYAKEMSEDYNARAEALYADRLPEMDIVITTALIPGRPAPRLITAEMVASMKAGSVIVDMAASNGGNVEGVVKDQAVVTDNGVTIIGYTDLAGRLPTQASQLYATNLVNLMKLMTPGKDGRLVLDFDDVVQRSITVVRDGEVTWPPPPVQVSAAPPAQAASAVEAAVSPVKKHMSAARRFTIVGVAAGLLFVLAAVSPRALLVILALEGLSMHVSD
jgi:NAD(P) transhydrogenase subunit alpha